MFDKYAEYYDILNKDKDYKKEIEFVYAWADKPKRIFDIGCGTGSYWKHYPRETSILGIEKSKAMIESAKLYPNRAIIHGDIRKSEYPHRGELDCATALFDVLNYIPKHDWWPNIPIKKGGYFIFDVFNSKKVYNDGFETTYKQVGEFSRRVTPIRWDGKSVDLMVTVLGGHYADLQEVYAQEKHRMYIHTEKQILNFCMQGGFRLIEIKETKQWQQWWKIQKI